MDTESNVISIAAWVSRSAPDAHGGLSLIPHDGGRLIPFKSTGSPAVPADEAHAPTDPAPGTAA